MSNGKFLTLKHTALALGLHSITGLKLPIIMLSRLGHSITNDMVREIETAQAELAEEFFKEGKSLPILPKDDDAVAPTILWWDNFDRFIDSSSGENSIHNTPGVAFQEKTENTVLRADKSIPKSKRRSLELPKWKILRFGSRRDQRYPRFSGMVYQTFKKNDEQKTYLTYLPPIETPIGDYGTLLEVFVRSEQMAKQGNMLYTHIVMDCGAAIKAYHVLWNNPERFSKIILHLGDFHFMQAFFKVIGNFVEGSGFEDIVYQLGLSQPGSMKAILKGKHYNQGWLIHESFSEAIFRLFLERYTDENIKERLSSYDSLLEIDDTDVTLIEALFSQGLDGEFGATQQYWLQYVDFIDSLHGLHYSIQVNDWELRLYYWRKVIIYFFFFDKLWYSRTTSNLWKTLM